MKSTKRSKIGILAILLTLACLLFFTQLMLLWKLPTQKETGIGELPGILTGEDAEDIEEVGTPTPTGTLTIDVETTPIVTPSIKLQFEKERGFLEERIAELESANRRISSLEKEKRAAQVKLQEQEEILEKRLTEYLEENEAIRQLYKEIECENLIYKEIAGRIEGELTTTEKESLELQDELLSIQGKISKLEEEKGVLKNEKMKALEAEKNARDECKRLLTELSKEQASKEIITEEIEKVEEEITRLLKEQATEAEKNITRAHAVIEWVKKLGAYKNQPGRLQDASNLLILAEEAARKDEYARSITLSNEAISQAQVAEECYIASKQQSKKAILERALHLLTLWAY